MKTKALRLKKRQTAREQKAIDPQGYAEANGHCWPPYPSARPFPVKDKETTR